MGSLEEEAAEVISLKKGLRIKDPASNTPWVHTDKRVRCTGITSKLDDLRVFGSKDRYISLRKISEKCLRERESI